MSPLRPFRADPDARAALWISAAFLFVFVAATRGHFVGTDEIAAYQTTRSLWENGSLAVAPINNTFPGADGRTYSQYPAGQSVAALPLYGIGKAAAEFLSRPGRDAGRRALAGPEIGTEPNRWGGDVEIFFVNLFNAFLTALLCAIFFAFSRRLGASPGASLAATALLGLTSYVAPFSAGFLEHTSEALFVTWAFYLLYANRARPGWTRRVGAGAAAGAMLLVRIPSLIALPGLVGYLTWSEWERAGRGSPLGRRVRTIAAALLQFALPAVVALGINAALNLERFGTILGRYNNEGFHTPLAKGLDAFLLSPGDSLFLFTPVLLLLPWTLAEFAHRRRAEATAIAAITATYLCFYAKYTAWHGLWSAMGPRYLVPLVPLLLLPTGPWLSGVRLRRRLVTAALAALGLAVQAATFGVNFAYLYQSENYPAFRPQYDFLFLPQMSPLLAAWRALLQGDFRVDFWLLNVARRLGTGRMLEFAIPLAAAVALCLWRLRRALRDTRAGEPGAFPPPRAALLGVLLVFAAAGIRLAHASSRWSQRNEVARHTAAMEQREGEYMRRGLDELFSKRDFAAAAIDFRKVLDLRPGHYGATFQLARTLDLLGRRDEARAYWERTLRMAEKFRDAETARMARERLGR